MDPNASNPPQPPQTEGQQPDDTQDENRTVDSFGDYQTTDLNVGDHFRENDATVGAGAVREGVLLADHGDGTVTVGYFQSVERIQAGTISAAEYDADGDGEPDNA